MFKPGFPWPACSVRLLASSVMASSMSGCLPKYAAVRQVQNVEDRGTGRAHRSVAEDVSLAVRVFLTRLRLAAGFSQVEMPSSLAIAARAYFFSNA